MSLNTVAQPFAVRQESPATTAAKLALARHVRQRHEVWQAQLAARAQAERQRFTDAVQAIKAQHGSTWQRYPKSAARSYEVIVFGEPFAEDAVTIEFRETVTVIHRYGCAPNYFLAANARSLFSLLRA